MCVCLWIINTEIYRFEIAMKQLFLREISQGHRSIMIGKGESRYMCVSEK